jgi:hypothetical protein
MVSNVFKIVCLFLLSAASDVVCVFFFFVNFVAPPITFSFSAGAARCNESLDALLASNGELRSLAANMVGDCEGMSGISNQPGSRKVHEQIRKIWLASKTTQYTNVLQ